MKNKICIFALVLSLFLFAQYLYSHWPELEVSKSIELVSPYGFAYRYGDYDFCDKEEIIEKEEDVGKQTFTIDLETGKSYGPTIRVFKEKVEYFPCYKETRSRHWENLWK